MSTCTTTSSLSCCSDKTIVQDKVCTNWVVPAAGTQIIYSDNISQIISGTGYVKFEVGTGPLTITFSQNAGTVQTITILAGSSYTFTISRFDTITLGSTADAEGEFCITVRYSL
ncbi:DUF3992 domain-containing protein [Paenibacillus psychroresistens]|uniref:DUF3992 domain-containing protein n=1 Tax=Paenibacillus psychroresistens TaxID=1778678 RepID=A0A6B8RYC9_9BACL|nr:S-Ena type endospore appendage [Paenibacillus psychroresistens]QGR00284.1 DUF3992 domain-containing protein [Paenibacillus psychroresistens]